MLSHKKTLRKKAKKAMCKKAKKMTRKRPAKKIKVRRVTIVRRAKIAKPLGKKPLRKEKKPLGESPDIKKKMDEQSAERIVKILADSYVRQMLIELGGENALAIIRNFYGNHSDEELAKKLKLKISDVRATLNKLHNEGLVNYIREKDSETGWYSYSWSLNLSRIEKWASLQTTKFGGIEGGGAAEYYFCTSCGASTITNFESAVSDNFRCERCNRLLEYIDEKRMLELYEKKR